MPVQIFKTRTRRITLLLVGALLFAQLALAAHACTMPNAPWGAERNVVDVAHVPADAADLAECMGHCQTAQQHVDDKPLPLPTLAWASGFVANLTWTHAGVAEAPTDWRAAPWRAEGPPHTILHCCWRI